LHCQEKFLFCHLNLKSEHLKCCSLGPKTEVQSYGSGAQEDYPCYLIGKGKKNRAKDFQLMAFSLPQIPLTHPAFRSRISLITYFLCLYLYMVASLDNVNHWFVLSRQKLAKLIERIEELEKLPGEYQETLVSVLDSFIKRHNFEELAHQ